MLKMWVRLREAIPRLAKVAPLCDAFDRMDGVFCLRPDSVHEPECRPRKFGGNTE